MARTKVTKSPTIELERRRADLDARNREALEILAKNSSKTGKKRKEATVTPDDMIASYKKRQDETKHRQELAYEEECKEMKRQRELEMMEDLNRVKRRLTVYQNDLNDVVNGVIAALDTACVVIDNARTFIDRE